MRSGGQPVAGPSQGEPNPLGMIAENPKKTEYADMQHFRAISIAMLIVAATGRLAIAQDGGISVRVTTPTPDKQCVKVADIVGGFAIDGAAQDLTQTVWVVVYPVGTGAFWVQDRAYFTGATDTEKRQLWEGTAIFGTPSTPNAFPFQVRAFILPVMGLSTGQQLERWPAARYESPPIIVRHC